MSVEAFATVHERAAPLHATIPRVPSQPAPEQVGVLPPTFGSALTAPGVGALVSEPVAQPQAVPQPLQPTTSVTPAAVPTTVRYVTPPVVTVAAPAVGTYGGLPYSGSLPPLGQTYFPGSTSYTENSFPFTGVDPMASARSIGLGGFDFKFYGPGERNPLGLGEPIAGGMGFGEPAWGQGETYGSPPDDVGSPPPPPPPLLQEADRYDRIAAEHEHQVELLEQAPPTSQNLQQQVHELSEAHRAIQHELQDVKAQVQMHYRDLEVLRREAILHASMPSPQPGGHFDQDYGRPPPEGHYGPVDPVLSRVQDYGPTPGPDQDRFAMSPRAPSAAGSAPFGPAPLVSQGGQRMPPRNLGYEGTAGTVLESLTNAATTLHGHATNAATTIHGHATRTLRNATGAGAADDAGSNPGQAPTVKKKACGAVCP